MGNRTEEGGCGREWPHWIWGDDESPTWGDGIIRYETKSGLVSGQGAMLGLAGETMEGAAMWGEGGYQESKDQALKWAD